MLKKGTSGFLLLVILFQTFGQVVVVASFYLQRDFIVSVLCENKAKPAMKCKGKCYLNKQLQKHQQEENQNSEQTIRLRTDLYVAETFTLIPANPSHTVPKLFFELNEAVLPGEYQCVFRPPIC
jgi:hypothetical protein